MGMLVVRHYPTKRLLKAADHTYVECGTGATGWRCFGRKTGGAFLRSAPGSTNRANAIAGRAEQAGVTCYLVNGVCHQAANRILLPSGITVDGARGYSLSISIFGVFGRPRGVLGLCKAPFVVHAGVTGDLKECLGDATEGMGHGQSEYPLDFADERYMSEVLRLYNRTDYEDFANTNSLLELQMQHFKLFVSHKLGHPGDRITSQTYAQLMLAREEFERQRLLAEEKFAATQDGMRFVENFDALTLAFQDSVSKILYDDRSYRTLLNLRPDERVVLSDPEIIELFDNGKPDPDGAAS